MDFEIIIQECFLGDPLPKLLKRFCSVSWVTLYQNCSNGSALLNKMAARAINRNKLLTTSFAKRWTDFEIISHECSLGNPLTDLLNPFRSVEQDGRQS